MEIDVSNLNEIDKELKVEININIFGSNCNFLVGGRKTGVGLKSQIIFIALKDLSNFL